MPVTSDQVDEILARPREAFNVELKNWITPDNPDGQAKIVKAVMALYNRDGGYLLIGFDNQSLQPVTTLVPANIRTLYDQDTIQQLVSRYSSEPIEVQVEFRDRNGISYPILRVPSGVKTVTAVKRDLTNGSGGYLLRKSDVYFRSLRTNGAVSSAKAEPNDWGDILNICFDNREADIGRFIRRHLPDDMGQLRQLICGSGSGSNFLGVASAVGEATPADRLSARTSVVLEQGKARFNAALSASTQLPVDGRALEYGRWHISLVLEPPLPNNPPTGSFLNKLDTANPSLIGWPVWLNSSSFREEAFRPRVIEGAWQTFIVSFEGWSRHVELQRIVPSGEFYLGRVMQDDLNAPVEARAVLDPILVVIRVAEVMAVGLAFAKALDVSPTSLLGFRFQWVGLAGRVLSAWAQPHLMFAGRGPAMDDASESFVVVPADAPNAALPTYVTRATSELFSKFSGTELPDNMVEDHVMRLLERRLP
jgi:hypothetical protein